MALLYSVQSVETSLTAPGRDKAISSSAMTVVQDAMVSPPHNRFPRRSFLMICCAYSTVFAKISPRSLKRLAQSPPPSLPLFGQNGPRYRLSLRKTSGQMQSSERRAQIVGGKRCDITHSSYEVLMKDQRCFTPVNADTSMSPTLQQEPPIDFPH